MNRKASTRAFVNPCPGDPLGRQMVYMHMSSHYRRMYSAHSVVDSAAPSRRRAPRAPPTTLSGNLISGVTQLKQGAGRTLARSSPYLSGAKKARIACPTIAAEPASAVLGLNLSLAGIGKGRNSMATPSNPSSSAQDPSRATVLPSSLPTNAHALRIPRGSVAEPISRCERSRQSMRGDEGHLSSPKTIPHRSKLKEKPGTFLAKFDQLARVPRTGFVGGVSEEVPSFKPRILHSNVQSKLRDSPVYHPPRPRASVPPKTQVAANDVRHRSVDSPRIKLQSSPPSSSRDSAYNGGVSSCGESHLRPRGASADATTDRRQKRRGWSVGAAGKLFREAVTDADEERGALDLNVAEKNIGDGGLVSSPAYSYFSSIASSHLDGTHADRRGSCDQSATYSGEVESHIEEDESQLDGGSAFEDESRFGDDSPQTDEVRTKSTSLPKELEDSTSNSSQVEVVLEELSPRTPPRARVDKTVQVEYPLNGIANATVTTSTGSLNAFASVAVSASVPIERPEARSVGNVTENATKSESDIVNDVFRWPDTAYVRLIHAFTSDVVRRGILTNKALKSVFQEHVEANRHELDMERVLEEWDKFRINLNIPKEEHQQTANYGLGSAPENRATILSPLTSQPSECRVWTQSKDSEKRHHPTVFVANPSTSEAATAVTSSLCNCIYADLYNRATTDDEYVQFDPVGIMGPPGATFRVPRDNDIDIFPLPSFPLSPLSISIAKPPPSRTVADRSRRPYSEPPHRPTYRDAECVCGKSLCLCTSTEKIVDFMTKWVDSPPSKGGVRPRSGSVGTTTTSNLVEVTTSPIDVIKVDENPQKSDPPLPPPPPSSPPRPTDTTTKKEETHDKSGTDISEKTAVPPTARPPKDAFPLKPEPVERKSVKIAKTAPNNLKTSSKVREKMLVCLYNPQNPFSSNDSVNEGIFGRNETTSNPVKNPDLPITAPEKPIVNKTEIEQNLVSGSPSPLSQLLLEHTDLALSPGTFSPTPNFDEYTIADEEFPLLADDMKFLRWLESKAPATNCQ